MLAILRYRVDEIPGAGHWHLMLTTFFACARLILSLNVPNLLYTLNHISVGPQFILLVHGYTGWVLWVLLETVNGKRHMCKRVGSP